MLIKRGGLHVLNEQDLCTKMSLSESVIKILLAPTCFSLDQPRVQPHDFINSSILTAHDSLRLGDCIMDANQIVTSATSEATKASRAPTYSSWMRKDKSPCLYPARPSNI